MINQPGDEKIMDELKGMTMHDDWVVDNNLVIQRVPGGWNYKYYDSDFPAMAVVFVPMPKSFMKEY